MLPKSHEDYLREYLDRPVEEIAEMKDNALAEYTQAIDPEMKEFMLDVYTELKELLRFKLSLNYILRTLKNDSRKS